MVSPGSTSGTIPIEGLDTRNELTEEQGKPIEDLITIPQHDSNP